MHQFKPFVLAGLALAMLVGSGATNALAAPGPSTKSAEAWFVGTATSGVGSPMPIDINPADITFRADGAIGIGYVYMASGDTQGKAAGHFVYEEHGYLFFRNPADPTTYMGSQYVHSGFTLTLRKGGVVAITDSNPSGYLSGINTISVPKGISKGLTDVYGKSAGQLIKGGALTYGYFTFSDSYGTFIGYATPDFRQFAIDIKFDCAAC